MEGLKIKMSYSDTQRKSSHPGFQIIRVSGRWLLWPTLLSEYVPTFQFRIPRSSPTSPTSASRCVQIAVLMSYGHDIILYAHNQYIYTDNIMIRQGGSPQLGIAA